MAADLGSILYKVGQSLLSVSAKRVLAGAGIGVVSYEVLSTQLKSMIMQSAAQIQQGDAFILGMMGVGGFDESLSIIFSSVLIRIALFSSKLSFIKLE